MPNFFFHVALLIGSFWHAPNHQWSPFTEIVLDVGFGIADFVVLPPTLTLTIVFFGRFVSNCTITPSPWRRAMTLSDDLEEPPDDGQLFLLLCLLG